MHKYRGLCLAVATMAVMSSTGLASTIGPGANVLGLPSEQRFLSSSPIGAYTTIAAALPSGTAGTITSLSVGFKTQSASGVTFSIVRGVSGLPSSNVADVLYTFTFAVGSGINTLSASPGAALLSSETYFLKADLSLTGPNYFAGWFDAASAQTGTVATISDSGGGWSSSTALLPNYELSIVAPTVGALPVPLPSAMAGGVAMAGMGLLRRRSGCR